MRFYKSRSSIWWNKGLETKPTYNDFSQIEWEELTNFNVNWLSEISISCVVGLQDTFDLIKIENEEAEVSHEKVKYYYLTEVLDKTKINKTCIFELDIWTTYFLEPQNQNETNLHNIKMYSDIKHDLEEVKTQWREGTQSRLVSITPAGLVRTNKRKLKSLSREIPLPKTQAEANSTLEGDFWAADAAVGTTADKAGSIYYVFNTSGDLGKYLLVPLVQTSGKFPDKNIKIFWKMRGITQNGFISGNDQFWVKARIGYQNTEERLKNAALKDTHKINFWVDDTKYTTTSLVGVFVGPHFSSFKKYTLLGDSSLPYAKLNSSNETGIPDVGDEFYTAGMGPSGIMIIPYSKGLGVGFLCGPEGLELEPLHNSYLLEKYLQGYNYLQNPNVHIINSATRVFFTDRFIFTTETESVEVFTELPYFTSSYTEYLRGARVNLETSYGLKQLNALTGIVGSLIGVPGSLFTPTSTYTTNRLIDNSAVNTVKRISTDRDTIKWGSRYRLGETVNNTANRTWTPAMRGVAGTSSATSSKSSNVNWGYDDTQRASLNTTAITTKNVGAHTRNITTTGTRTGSANVAGVYGGLINSTIGAGLQFATNFLERKAFFTDLRNSTVVQNTTNSSSFLSYVCLLALSYGGGTESIDGNFRPTVAYLDGIELDVNQSWYNLYGYETNTYESPLKIREIGSNTNPQIFTLRLPDTLKPSFTFKYSATLSPLIRELIWTLLNQGVIIVSKQKLQEIEGSNELFNT